MTVEQIRELGFDSRFAGISPDADRLDYRQNHNKGGPHHDHDSIRGIY